MELIKTTPELAKEITNRVITITNGRIVKWINLNNRTLFATDGLSGSIYDLDDIDLYINVPSNCKTIF